MNVQRTFKKIAYSWNYHPDQVENSRSWPHIPSDQLISHPKGNHYPDLYQYISFACFWTLLCLNSFLQHCIWAHGVVNSNSFSYFMLFHWIYNNIFLHSYTDRLFGLFPVWSNYELCYEHSCTWLLVNISTCLLGIQLGLDLLGQRPSKSFSCNIIPPIFKTVGLISWFPPSVFESSCSISLLTLDIFKLFVAILVFYLFLIKG